MITRVVTLAAGASLALGAAAIAAPAAKPTPATGVLAPIHQFIDSFNKGDIKTAEGAHVAAPTIIDEVPPHHWQGQGAFQAWAGDLEKDAKKNGQSDEKVTLGPAVRTQVDGDDGYAVMKATFSYKQRGKAMVEPAQMVFALHKEAGAWKITGWTWAGTVPHAAAAAKPAAKPAAPAAPPAAAPPPKPKG